jgi:hypothetical protein
VIGGASRRRRSRASRRWPDQLAPQRGDVRVIARQDDVHLSGKVTLIVLACCVIWARLKPR